MKISKTVADSILLLKFLKICKSPLRATVTAVQFWPSTRQQHIHSKTADTGYGASVLRGVPTLFPGQAELTFGWLHTEMVYHLDDLSD